MSTDTELDELKKKLWHFADSAETEEFEKWWAALIAWCDRSALQVVLELIGEDEPEEERPYNIQYRDSELTDLAQFARNSGRNELRATLRTRAMERLGEDGDSDGQSETA